MNSYLHKLEVFKKFTKDLATLSKCCEKGVAAIITDASLAQIYSLGVNGGPKGLSNCLCGEGSKYGCIHAEVNALVKCNSVDTNKIMFVTLSPCRSCAAAIINAPGSFKTVYYFEKWKDDSGLKLLDAAGIYTVLL